MIKRSITRPQPALLEKLADMPTSWIADAQGGRGVLPHTIRPVTTHHRLVGPALCVQSKPIYNLALFAALPQLQAGDVLLLATGGNQEAACFGDFMTGMARNCGAAGLVTDGLVRDIDGLNRIGLPVFAGGISPRPPLKRDGPGRIGFGVTVGGIKVSSGDVIVADSDGVVVVPSDGLVPLLEELKRVKAKEDDAEATVRAGGRQPDGFPDALATKPVRYLS
jgi:4-hydroxy-4-methyl-2-oxoglutarate aldolase